MLFLVIFFSNKFFYLQYCLLIASFYQFTEDSTSANLLILCIEELVGITAKNLLARTPIILQALYENDILEEEAILKWADSAPESSYITREVAVAVRDAAKPFSDWLKEAESDSDEDEE